MCYFILIPLVLLSPWMCIPYTDTFAILFPILILYLYTKKTKSLITYYLISFLSVFGFYIKPTVIIVFIAIVIVELFINIINIRQIGKFSCKVVVVVLGVLTSIFIYSGSSKLLKIQPIKNVNSFNYIHYLAMGQNNDTFGIYNERDVEYSIRNSKKADLKKFYSRISKRNVKQQVLFLTKKL